MKGKSSFLKNLSALEEIRKHKWIESEKAGYDIGFATAALDWIKKYGQAWEETYLNNKQEAINGII